MALFCTVEYSKCNPTLCLRHHLCEKYGKVLVGRLIYVSLSSAPWFIVLELNPKSSKKIDVPRSYWGLRLTLCYILFNQTWDNWNQNLAHADRVMNSLTLFTWVCVFFFKLNLPTYFSLCSQKDTNFAFYLFTFCTVCLFALFVEGSL